MEAQRAVTVSHSLVMHLQEKEIRSECGRMSSSSGRTRIEGQVYSRQRERHVQNHGGMNQPGVGRELWEIGNLHGGAGGSPEQGAWN